MKISYRAVFDWVFAVVLFVVGVAFYSVYEKWTIMESVLFVIATITTVGKCTYCDQHFIYHNSLKLSSLSGYGYRTPTDGYSKLFTLFFILAGIVFIFTVVSDVLLVLFVELRQLLFRSVSEDDIEIRIAICGRLVSYNFLYTNSNH